MPGVSIVLCCHNSKSRLEPTLVHLANLYHDFFEIELILVDNASIDESGSFAASIWLKLGEPYPIIIRQELKVGLSYARFTGVSNAKYDTIIFCDDDNWLDKNYAAIAYELMLHNKDIGAAGGLGLPASAIELPDWFEEYKGGYAIGNPDVSSGYINGNHLLTGAGMVIRKELFLTAYQNLNSLLTDRTGVELSSGGDTEICFRMKLLGFQLYYEREMEFKHFLPEERLTIAYRNKLFASFKSMAPVVDYYSKILEVKYMSLVNRLLRALFICLKLPFTYLKLIKRWDIKRDLLEFYILTGLLVIDLPSNWLALRKRFLSRK